MEKGRINGFMSMEHEFPFGMFRVENQDYLLRCSFAPGHPESRVPFIFHPEFPENFFKMKIKQPSI